MSTQFYGKSQDFIADLKSGKLADMIKEETKGESISNSKELYNILKPVFASGNDEDVERLFGIFLDAKNKIIQIKELSSGTITSSAVYPREIIKEVLRTKAACLILGHNHPSGDTLPSNEDIRVTKKICFALKSIDVTLHEHIIIGNNNYYSLADNEIISKHNASCEEFMNDL